METNTNETMTLKEQISNRCIHFTGMMDQSCKKGIKYSTVKISSKPVKRPCFKSGRLSGGQCSSAQFPSDSEVDKEVEESEKMMMAAIGAYSYVKEHFHKTGKRSGEIDCPSCGSPLRYRVAEYNNHIRAKCSGCDVSFIE